jgi:phage terminase Nu1 subunit (DNA packaging protein)
MSNLTWPTDRMAKLIDVSPRRLQQLVQEGIVPKSEGRGRYNPILVTQAYIRFLRDRVQSPELSDSEFFAAKLAKLKSEREQIELDMQIKRGERIPIEDTLSACDIVFKAMSGILKANVNKLLTVEQINEIFDMMRATTRQLREDYCGNGQYPA